MSTCDALNRLVAGCLEAHVAVLSRSGAKNGCAGGGNIGGRRVERCHRVQGGQSWAGLSPVTPGVRLHPAASSFLVVLEDHAGLRTFLVCENYSI